MLALRPTRVWAVGGLALVATLSALGRQPLSWDEAVTFSAAQRSPSRLLGLLGNTDATVGLYYFAMHGWLQITHAVGLPTAEWVLRLPRAMALIAASVSLVRLLQAWYSVSTSVLAGALLAVFPLATFYAQDARPYALVMLAFLGSTHALRRALQFGSPTVVFRVLRTNYHYAVLAFLRNIRGSDPCNSHHRC